VERRSSIPEKGIAVNRYDARFPAPAERAFCRFQLTDVNGTLEYQVRRSDLKIVGGVDQWDPLEFVSDQGQYSAVTSRAFGLERAAYEDTIESLFKTGDVVFDGQTEEDSAFPHLETQRVRLDDLFLTSSVSTDRLDLFQLHP
jgi:hypothetical protein